VLGFYRRRLRDTDGVAGQSGAVTVVQRSSADLRLNPHFHSVVLDGVFAVDGAPGAAGTSPVASSAEQRTAPPFHDLAALDTGDVADLLQVIRARVLAFLRRRGVVEGGDALGVLDDGFAEREPALAALAVAAVQGLPPAGPVRRRRAAVVLRASPGVEVDAPCCVSELGFSLHAATTAGAFDPRGREALLRYVLRPPVAQERLQRLPDDLVRILLRKPFRDGTVAIDLDPLSLLSRLAAIVPPPRFHTVRYGGVLAPASRLRARVVPPPPTSTPPPPPPPPPPNQAPATAAATATPAPAAAATPTAAAIVAATAALVATPAPPPPLRRSDRPTHRSVRRLWAALLRHTFGAGVETCRACGGRFRLRALVTAPASVLRLLRSFGEPTEFPPRAPARDPPTYQSRVLRRRALDLDPSSDPADLFAH
jgi:hypothetical protein